LIKLETKDYHPKATHQAKPHLDATMWVVWANTQIATVRGFFCLFWFLLSLLVTLTGRTSSLILTTYTSYDVFPHKDVPFGGCIDTAPYLGSQIAQKPQFRGHE